MLPSHRSINTLYQMRSVWFSGADQMTITCVMSWPSPLGCVLSVALPLYWVTGQLSSDRQCVPKRVCRLVLCCQTKRWLDQDHVPESGWFSMPRPPRDRSAITEEIVGNLIDCNNQLSTHLGLHRGFLGHYGTWYMLNWKRFCAHLVDFCVCLPSLHVFNGFLFFDTLM